ncbi:MAG: hypothetical protein WBH85_12220 [Thermoanaerobaculia bacterium]
MKRKKEQASEQRPSRVFASEGYTITCKLDGLEIEAVDYHAGVLRIAWRDLERLMVESGLVPPRAERESQQSSETSVH